jgi:hypothetical protein
MSGGLTVAVVDLNHPGRYLHWSIFTVSVANLALIAVMVVIFAAALLIRFPDHSRGEEASRGPAGGDRLAGRGWPARGGPARGGPATRSPATARPAPLRPSP